MNEDPKDILFQDLKKDICAFLHVFDTKFQAQSYEHAIQEREISYKRYRDDPAFYAAVNVLVHMIMNILNKKYLILDKQNLYQRLCNYFNCSDSNDNQYPNCINQFTDSCPSGGLLSKLCKSEDIENLEDINEKDEMIEQLKHALAQTLVLQNHYASLLNMQDGGQRKIFKNIDEWIQKLSDLESAKEPGI